MTEQQAEIMIIAMHTVDDYLGLIADELKELRKHAEQQTLALDSIAKSLATLTLRPVG